MMHDQEPSKSDREQKLEDAFRHFISCAMTCKRRNEPAWMEYFAQEINTAIAAVGEDGGVEWPGTWANEFHLQSGG